MAVSKETIEPRKKEMVKNLYCSGIPIDIIALQTDLVQTSVLKVIEEIESGVPQISCPYCSSIFKNQKVLLKHLGQIHTATYC
ncbi:MAG: hypothetical protein ACE5J2_00645 [Nitrososphaerales archaeon]